MMWSKKSKQRCDKRLKGAGKVFSGMADTYINMAVPKFKRKK